jgi:aminoglycoside/choline kinase family phosphotransferase
VTERARDAGGAGAGHPEVASWLARHGLFAAAIEGLAGDVSTRRYYRVALRGESATWIVARYPPDLAPAQRRFAAAGELLAAAGVRVPALRLDDAESGLALVEDLGPAALHERFARWEDAADELAAALAAADAVARLDIGRVAALGSPPLDATLLRRELQQTIDLLLAPRGLAVDPVARVCDALCERLTRPPLVACHRDFMARNLMPLAPAGVGVLDFQDLRLGPPGYDLASLLNDTLFADAATEERALAEWPRLAGGSAQYRAAVAQRSLKAVGTYLAFARRGMRRHLPLIAPTLERALAAMAELPETAVLAAGEWPERLRAAGRAAALC